MAIANILAEILCIVLFASCFYQARSESKRILMLIKTAIFGLLIGVISVQLFSKAQINLFYPIITNGWTILGIPIVLILMWIILIYSGSLLTDYLNVKESKKPFADAILATLPIIALDPVLTRMNFWQWFDYKPIQGFFGTPFSFFLDWLIMSFVFMMAYRYSNNFKRKNLVESLMILMGIVIILIERYGILLIKETSFLPELTFAILGFGLLLVFMIVSEQESIRRLKPGRKDIAILYGLRAPFYFVAIIGAIWLKTWQDSPFLPITIFLILVIEFMLDERVKKF